MGFVFMAVLIRRCFDISFIATYMVTNTGTPKNNALHLFGRGICTLAGMNLIGRWSDRVGKRACSGSCPRAPRSNFDVHQFASRAVFDDIAVTTLFMVCMSAARFRDVDDTSSVKARYRGGFMSANSACSNFPPAWQHT